MARADLDILTLDDLKDKLQANIFSALEAARAAADLEQAAVSQEKIVVTYYDKFYKAIGETADYLSLACNFPRNEVPAGTLNLKRTDPMASVALTCEANTVPVTVEVGHLLWSGRVKMAHDNFNLPEQADYVECILEGDYAWLMKIVAWPNFLLPIQTQWPPRGVAIGPAITCLKYLLATQAFRVQSGMWDLVNNLLSLDLDWRTWFANAFLNDPSDPDHGGILSALRTPIYVVPEDPLLDTSPFISVNWRMDKIGTIFKQQLEDNGLYVDVHLWRPGDPQPGSDPLLSISPLTVPTIVVDIKDRSGVIGPSGTWVDGIIRDAVNLEGSVMGQVLSPFLNPKGEYAPQWLGINIAPILGVNFVQPWVIFNADNPQSGVWGKISHHHPESWRVIVGGKSPQWLDDLINATTSWLLDALMILIGFTGIPSNLFDGLFSDVLLAFQLADNFDRRVQVGPYGYPEVFVPMGDDEPYSIDGVFALIREMWNTQGYLSGQVQFRNGLPYEIGRDLFPGALASIVRNGQLYTDYVDNITLHDTPDNRTEIFVQIGNGKQEEAPIVRIQRTLVSFEQAFNILTLATH